MPTNFEAIGSVPSYAWSRNNSGTGYGYGQYPFVLYNRAVLPHKTTTKLLIFVISFDLNNKLNDPIVGSLIRSKSRVFNDFISYIE